MQKNKIYFYRQFEVPKSNDFRINSPNYKQNKQGDTPLKQKYFL